MKKFNEKDNNFELGRSRSWVGHSALRLERWPVLASLLAMVMIAAVVEVVNGQNEMEYPSSGVNFESCRSSDNCAGPRKCLALLDGGRECTDSHDNCLCADLNGFLCSTSGDCDRGERCIQTGSGDSKELGCVSCQVLEASTLTYVDENPSTCDGVWPGGYSFDLCGLIRPLCEGSRSCIQYINDDGDLEGDSERCANEKTLCYCKPTEVIKCSSTTDCEEGDQCAKVSSDSTSDPICMSCGRVANDPDYEGVDSPTSSLCTSFSESSTSSDTSASASPAPVLPTSSASPSPAPVLPTSSASPLAVSAPRGSSSPVADSSPSSSPGGFVDPGPPIEPPCIAVAHLAQVHQKDLVFATHRRASVLCDSGGSCATRGHIVTFYGRPMSMASYCSLPSSSCSARVAYVNSPRMQRGLKIASLTRGLHFTTFSARYESRLEEVFMSVLIYIGF